MNAKDRAFVRKYSRLIKRNVRIGYIRARAKRILRDDDYADYDTRIRDAFFCELEYRCKKNRGRVKYDTYYYYETSNQRLALVKRGDVLERKTKRGVIDKEEHKSHVPITTDNEKNFMIISQKSILDTLDEDMGDSMSKKVKDSLEKYFDGFDASLEMVIDDNFHDAYEPSYHDNRCTDGDLATGQSCMSCCGDVAEQFYGQIHGCKIVRFIASDGSNVGRCIVYEFNGIRHFVRIYGKYQYQRTMLKMIRDEMKPGDLFGRSKKINGLKLETDWDFNNNVMYLDGNWYGALYDKGKYWVVDESSFDDGFELKEIDTTLSIEDVERNTLECQYCENSFNEEDGVWVDCAETYYCCEQCAMNDGYHRCEHCCEWCYESSLIVPENYDKVFCCEQCARKHGFHQCDDCGRWIHTSDLCCTSDFDENDIRYLCQECYTDALKEFENKKDDGNDKS